MESRWWEDATTRKKRKLLLDLLRVKCSPFEWKRFYDKKTVLRNKNGSAIYICQVYENIKRSEPILHNDSEAELVMR